MIKKTYVHTVEKDYDSHGADYGILKIEVPYDIMEELKQQGLKAGDKVQITILK